MMLVLKFPTHRQSNHPVTHDPMNSNSRESKERKFKVRVPDRRKRFIEKEPLCCMEFLYRIHVNIDNSCKFCPGKKYHMKGLQHSSLKAPFQKIQTEKSQNDLGSSTHTGFPQD